MKKENLEDAFNKYYSAHRQGRLSQARKGYQKILKADPEWGPALSALGILFLDQNRPDKAKPLFEKAANLTPPDLSACYHLGRLKQLDNDHKGSITVYKVILDHQPESGIVWNNLGVAYRETGKPEDALSCFKAAIKFAPQMAQAWNNLGVAQDEHNQTQEAMHAYEKASQLEPDYASPHLNLGLLLQKSGHLKDAQAHYNTVLKIHPENEVATFMLQSISGTEIPEAAPVEHVKNIFDQCAENFETILVEGLEYKTPELLFNIIGPYLAKDMNILDLGCGTGLGAQFYQPFAKNLTGVDVSSKMLEKAAQKEIYSRLEVFDILQEWVFPEKFDLIYSSDVFVYFGNLDIIFRSAYSSLVHHGKIAFSVESLEEKSSTGYKLFPSGRYSHSQDYIEKCLSRNGFRVLKSEKTTVRNQSGKPVRGILVVAEKF